MCSNVGKGEIQQRHIQIEAQQPTIHSFFSKFEHCRVSRVFAEIVKSEKSVREICFVLRNLDNLLCFYKAQLDLSILQGHDKSLFLFLMIVLMQIDSSLLHAYVIKRR
jgi:hypothetical protein